MLLADSIAFMLILFPKENGHEKITVQTRLEAQSKEDKWFLILLLVLVLVV